MTVFIPGCSCFQRDLVQFVNYYKHYSDPEGLAHDALAEIPDQMVDYMRMNNIDPLPPPAEKSKESVIIFSSIFCSFFFSCVCFKRKFEIS